MALCIASFRGFQKTLRVFQGEALCDYAGLRIAPRFVDAKDEADYPIQFEESACKVYELTPPKCICLLLWV